MLHRARVLDYQVGTHEWFGTLAKYLHCVRTVCAPRVHCVGTGCILRTQRPGYSPKNTCHLTGCTAKRQSPHENDETVFNLVLHCPYEQTTQPCKVRLLGVFRCPWLRSWRRMRCPLTRSAGNALSVVSWVMGTANRVKGRAVVILSATLTVGHTFPRGVGCPLQDVGPQVLRPQIKSLLSKIKQDFQRKSTITHGCKSKMH